MKRKRPFLEIIVRRFARPSRISRNSAPSILNPKTKRFLQQRSVLHIASTVLARSAFILTLIGLSLALSVAHSAVREIGPIGLTVGNLNRELFFYTNTLPFRLISILELSGPDQDALFGLQNTKLHVATLQLGDERITLTEHTGRPGKPIPPDSRSFDHWFQHIAIVVSDMDKAYERLRSHTVKHVSTAPQTLPEWNKGAAGIKAFYFRDSEDHVLEIIFFPPGKGDPKWQHAGTNVFLGIDHTAIVVSDMDKSLAFYRDALGLRVAGESENYGVEQENLNQVFGAHLHITALRAEHGPGIELLEYLSPPGGRNLPSDTEPNDLIFWNTHLVLDDVTLFSAKLRERGVKSLSTPGSSGSKIIRDPDGHAMQLGALHAAVVYSTHPVIGIRLLKRRNQQKSRWSCPFPQAILSGMPSGRLLRSPDVLRRVASFLFSWRNQNMN